MVAVLCPCPLCKEKLVSSRKVRNSQMKICCYLPQERGEEGVEGDIPSDPEESDEVQGEPAVSDTENEELEQESVEENLQQLLVREALPFLQKFWIVPTVEHGDRCPHSNALYTNIYCCDSWIEKGFDCVQVYMRPNIAQKNV